MTTQGQPEPLGKSLNDYLQISGLARAAQAEKVFTAWRESVSDEAARHTRVLGLRNNVLAVEVDSGPWLHELNNFHREEILQSLKARLSQCFIEDIRFVLGNFE